MKKIFLYTLLIHGVALSLKAATPSIVSGVWNRSERTNIVALYQVTSGRLETLSMFSPQEDRTFGFAFNVREEGFYVIGTGSPLSTQDKYTFYFKPGDNLSIEINDSTCTLIGNNTEENVALTHWHQYISPLVALNTLSGDITYEDFFPLLQEYLSRTYTPLPTNNPVFDRAFAKIRDVNILDIATNFIVTPRTIHPQKEDFPDYYRNIDLPALTSDDFLLSYPFGSPLLSRLFLVNYVVSGNLVNSTDEALAMIGNNALKGEIVLQEAVRSRSYTGFIDLMNKYEQYLVLPDQKKRASEIGLPLAAKEAVPNQSGINFTGKDLNDKDVSLTDFKGKMVYVDVWATWCGPCIKEIPNIEKLMDDYKGKNIVFMSVSIDAEKDKTKWKNFVKDKNLKGVQIYAGKDSDLTKLYQVNAIPRFLLFDKKGNIVSTNAPRPSEYELRLMIDKGLKE